MILIYFLNINVNININVKLLFIIYYLNVIKFKGLYYVFISMLLAR